MNVNRTLIILLFSISCFSQNKKKDAYFIVNFNDKIYTLGNDIPKSEYTSLTFDRAFSLYDRIEYAKSQKEKEKKEVDISGLGGSHIPKTLTFRTKGNKKEIITYCDIYHQKLNVVDYNWLHENSWTLHNPNVIFKDLYFLFEIDINKYVKHKVERTLIAY